MTRFLFHRGNADRGDTLALRDYIAIFEFENNALTRVQMPEGFITAADTTLHLYITDHQGNIAGVYNTRTDSLEQRTGYYPYGLPHASASENGGPETNRRKFGAKELTADLGLNLYDFAARWHNPALPGFTTPDPLAEKYRDISSYVYCAADPINLIDPSGMDIWNINLNGEIVERIKTSDYDRINIVDNNGDPILDYDEKTVSYTFKHGTINGQFSFATKNGTKIDCYKISDQENATKLFEFLSNNISDNIHAVEFALTSTTDAKTGKYVGFVSTSHEANAEWGATQLKFTGKLDGYNIFEHIHSHSVSNHPSGGDKKVIEYLLGKNPDSISFKIYLVPERTYYEYE